MVKNPLASAEDVGSIPGSGRSPVEGNGNTVQLLLPGKSHGQRSLAGYSQQGRGRIGHDLATKQQQQEAIYKAP